MTLILEGLIGKRNGSRYEPGKRNTAWIKIKLHQEQEFVIGGYTEPEGSRKYFGALLVGFYEGEKLKFAGRVRRSSSQRLPRCLLLSKPLSISVEELKPARYGNGPERSFSGRFIQKLWYYEKSI